MNEPTYQIRIDLQPLLVCLVAALPALPACGLFGARSGGDTGFGPDAESDADDRWKITLSELYRSGDGCQLPECDESGTASVPVEKKWDWKKTTVNSTCGSVFKSLDKRAREGTTSKGNDSIAERRGTCLYDDSGDRFGTIRNDTIAICNRVEQRAGVVSYRIQITHFDENHGDGHLRSLLRNVPETAGGDCKIERRVEYDR